MTPIMILRSEHEAILRMLDSIEVMARRIQHGKQVPPAAISAATEWFSTFVHRIHRDKEEDVLFPLLHHKGLREGLGCVGTLLAAHDDGRESFKTMLFSMAEGDQASWARGVWAYAQMMRLHIRREDEVAFRLAETVLDDEDQATLACGFAAIDEKARVSDFLDRIRESERIVEEAVSQPNAA
jgi:hemerythrin-like domain-containing protein